VPARRRGLTEDFGVHTTVTWQTVVGAEVMLPSRYAKAAISAGAFAGLTALLGMVGVMADGSNATMLGALQGFLANVPAGANVAIAGHSLGGALSPVLALYMRNLQSWNAGGNVTMIGAWPTAGPTPGESNFVAYYASIVGQTLASGQAGLSYTSKYNSLEVIPLIETHLEALAGRLLAPGGWVAGARRADAETLWTGRSRPYDESTLRKEARALAQQGASEQLARTALAAPYP
jgi:hypothetical protein